MEDTSAAMTPSSFTKAWNTTSAMTPSSFTEAWNTTSAMAGGGGPSSIPFVFRFYYATLVLQKVWPSIILCLGTIGNVMTIIIMRRLKSDDSTINIYFAAIAGVDLVYLWTIVLNQVLQYNIGYDIKAIHGVFCKVFTWLYTGGGTVSCWYLVCMTVHRAMSVVWPHRVNVLCTRRTVLLMLSAVTVCIALLYSHYLIGLDIVSQDNGTSYKCTLATQDYNHFHTNIFVYIEVLVYSSLPFALLVLSNSALAWKLVASAKRASDNLTEGSRQVLNRERAANSVTLTVMVVSFTFLVLTLPSTINFVVNHLIYIGYTKTSLIQFLEALSITFVCTLLGHTNHAVNFYLYCLTGRRFREEFLKVLCCGRGGRRLLRVLSGKEAASG
ncbi:hypothetical protein ACOMHN_041975 [Nucella lapillus]